MSGRFAESIVEDAALDWLKGLGYAVLHGPDIAIGELAAERNDPNYRDTILERRLREAIVRLNPDLPSDALEDAFRKLSDREMDVLVHLARGKTNAEIGALLNLSEKTVGNYVSNMFEKLHLNNRIGLAAYAYEHHLFERM